MAPRAYIRPLQVILLTLLALSIGPAPASARASNHRPTSAGLVARSTKTTKTRGDASKVSKPVAKITKRKQKSTKKPPAKTMATAPTPTGPTPTPSSGPSVHVTMTTSNLSDALTAAPNVAFGTASTGGLPVITVNDGVRYQQVNGFGAAMTDASAWLLYTKLSPAARSVVIDNLFGAQGIHLNFLRVPMGASDFTTTGVPYTYDEMPAGESDPTLAHFSIAHDLAYIIPTLKQALAVNPQTQILANPWSPPAWMKANDALDNLSGAGTILAADYPELAQYFVKFIKAYAAQRVPVQDITAQNEPGVPAEYPGAELQPNDEATFTSQYLAPALKAAGLPTKIYGWDLNWALPSYPTTLESTPAASALAGIAWHCYSGNPDAMSAFEQQFPNLPQIVSECSPEILGFSDIELLISSLRNHASTVVLWNIALDPQGGPVEPPNSGCRGCNGVVTVNQATHAVSYSGKYYQLGQVSKFVQPGAVRVNSNSFVTYTTSNPTSAFSASAGIDDVALQNPDGSQVLVANNTAPTAIAFAVSWQGQAFTYTLPAHATITFTWN